MLTHNQKGAVAPLVAIMLVLIVVCVALVVDLGHIHNVKVELQRAVDAAALAGAQQLNGSAGSSQKAIDVAVATAAANTVDRDPVNIIPADTANPNFKGFAIKMVQPIKWDKNITDPVSGTPLSTSSRITPLSTAQYDTANGLWVTASMEVKHIFFFFTDNTPVTADAIAVATPEVPVLPLAIITCIPTEELLANPGALPDPTVCGISSYSFDPDREDSAAWTSLTFGANANDIGEFMEPGLGRDKFNQAIFGTGPTNNGLENEAVDTVPSPFDPDYPGCPVVFPNDLNINCGLGQIAGKSLATPGEFPIPTPLPDLTKVAGIYQPNPPFDPLTAYGRAYGSNGALPRWYNLNGENSAFDSSDHFTRLWTQDGILLRGNDAGTPETLTDYIARLTTLANCPPGNSSCRPYGDDRFLNGNFIVEPNGSFAQNLKSALGVATAPAYWPDFLEVVKHAGYPKVGVINGNTATVLAAFVENEMVTDGTNLKCSDNEPFPAGQTTLRVNAPVIFAGACESWKAISNAADPNSGFRYIGMSKLLLTRVWVKNNESYDCGEDGEVVQLPVGAACSPSDFDPPLRNSSYFNLPVTVSASLKGIEGLTLVPVADDEEDQGSLLKVFLVE